MLFANLCIILCYTADLVWVVNCMHACSCKYIHICMHSKILDSISANTILYPSHLVLSIPPSYHSADDKIFSFCLFSYHLAVVKYRLSKGCIGMADYQ